MWWKGPYYLLKKREDWPEEPELKMDVDGLNEMKKEKTAIFSSRERRDNYAFTQFVTKDWNKLRRFCAWAWRWRNRSKGTEVRTQDLTYEELEQAQTQLIRAIQKDLFKPEYKKLEKGELVKVSDPIRRLRPMIGQDGLLRVNSRLRATQLPEDMKHPMILSKGHPGVELLIRDIHERELAHVGGANTLFARTQQRYTTLGGRVLCKSIVRSCIHCQRLRAKETVPVMGPLPKSRAPAEFTRPFQHTIVDAAGPFLVTERRSQRKTYIILFSCLTFRAVHVETAPNLDTDGFLIAFTKFVARRGVPASMRSDNGGNFVRGREEIMNTNKFSKGYPDIKWEFSAPLSPHTNGAIERMVGAVKRGLEAVLTRAVSRDIFDALAVKVEGIVNSRPLGYITESVDDPHVLTPADYLTPLANNELPDLKPESESKFTQKFHLLQKLQNDLWQRFVEEYLPTLNEGRKWTRETEPLKVGDVGFLLEKSERGKFPLAIVTEVFPAVDGVVRKVNVRVNGKVYLRHARNFAKMIENP
jgi:hypothetical protein